MDRENRPFEAERSFGLGVLLKLTQKNTKGVEISSIGNKFTSNLSHNELNDAVQRIMETHNISLKIK